LDIVRFWRWISSFYHIWKGAFSSGLAEYGTTLGLPCDQAFFSFSTHSTTFYFFHHFRNWRFLDLDFGYRTFFFNLFLLGVCELKIPQPTYVLSNDEAGRFLKLLGGSRFWSERIFFGRSGKGMDGCRGSFYVLAEAGWLEGRQAGWLVVGILQFVGISKN